MACSNEPAITWTLEVEPDEDAEEELFVNEERVDPALISDETVRKCRILVTTSCTEYGTVSTSPTENTPAMLLVLKFTFHPFESRVKQAVVELSFSKGSIALLQPETVDDAETTETVRKKLTGEIKIGHPPVGVQGGVGAERETERIQTAALRIRGSGTHTHRATWTLKENPEDRKGIHLNFTAIVIVAVQGETEVDFEIRPKLAHSLGTDLSIRKAITRRTAKFDGKTLIGIRPATLDIHERCFSRISDTKT